MYKRKVRNYSAESGSSQAIFLNEDLYWRSSQWPAVKQNIFWYFEVGLMVIWWWPHPSPQTWSKLIRICFLTIDTNKFLNLRSHPLALTSTIGHQFSVVSHTLRTCQISPRIFFAYAFIWLERKMKRKQLFFSCNIFHNGKNLIKF